MYVHPFLFSLLEQLNKKYDNGEYANIVKQTGCIKPCKYNKYKLLGDPKTASYITDKFLFSLWAVSNNTWVETEELIYPLSSLVAEFGGTLGLFLGFSFMTIWDSLQFVRVRSCEKC